MKKFDSALYSIFSMYYILILGIISLFLRAFIFPNNAITNRTIQIDIFGSIPWEEIILLISGFLFIVLINIIYLKKYLITSMLLFLLVILFSGIRFYKYHIYTSINYGILIIGVFGLLSILLEHSKKFVFDGKSDTICTFQLSIITYPVLNKLSFLLYNNDSSISNGLLLTYFYLPAIILILFIVFSLYFSNKKTIITILNFILFISFIRDISFYNVTNSIKIVLGSKSMIDSVFVNIKDILVILFGLIASFSLLINNLIHLRKNITTALT